jgi:TRAP-type C4-dicarboxylate transport system permease small subunit
LKIISGIFSIAIAALAPIVVGVFTYISFTEWRDSRKAGYPTAGVAGCFPAALVAIGCYGHFFIAFQFYHAIGALRHT